MFNQPHSQRGPWASDLATLAMSVFIRRLLRRVPCIQWRERERGRMGGRHAGASLSLHSCCVCRLTTDADGWRQAGATGSLEHSLSVPAGTSLLFEHKLMCGFDGNNLQITIHPQILFTYKFLLLSGLRMVFYKSCIYCSGLKRSDA